MEALLKDLESKTKALLDFLKQEIGGMRTNRPSPQLVEDFAVDYLGQSLKLKQLGSISIVPPREIQISVWDKNALTAIAKVLETSPLGFRPSIEGKIIHLRLPPLTEERRIELIKIVKASTEKTRIKLRNLRDEANKKIVQALEEKTISEDQKFKSKKKVQDVIDKTMKDIDSLLANKIKEISE